MRLNKDGTRIERVSEGQSSYCDII